MVDFSGAYDIGYASENGHKLDVDPWNLTGRSGVRLRPFTAYFRVRGAERQKIIEQNWESVDKEIDALLERAYGVFKTYGRHGGRVCFFQGLKSLICMLY